MPYCCLLCWPEKPYPCIDSTAYYRSTVLLVLLILHCHAALRTVLSPSIELYGRKETTKRDEQAFMTTVGKLLILVVNCCPYQPACDLCRACSRLYRKDLLCFIYSQRLICGENESLSFSSTWN